MTLPYCSQQTLPHHVFCISKVKKGHNDWQTNSNKEIISEYFKTQNNPVLETSKVRLYVQRIPVGQVPTTLQVSSVSDGEGSNSIQLHRS